MTGLYQLVRGLDATQYEPLVLFHGPNPYRERFREIGVPVITLSETMTLVPPNTLPWVAASLARAGQDQKRNGSSPSGSSRSHAGAEQPSHGKRGARNTPRSRDVAARLERFSLNLGNAYRLAKQAYAVTFRHRPLAKRVASLIKENEIDLVHHNNSLPGNISTILAARMAGVSQISHVRDLKHFSAIDRYIGISVNAFVFMSTAIQQLYQELGISPHKGRVIYDAFDARAFAMPSSPDDMARTAHLRAELGIGEQDVMISNVGRLEWWKGQDYFVQAIASIVRNAARDSKTQGTVKAVLIGAPDTSGVSQAFYARLKQMVVDLGLSEHVIFAGFRSDVPQLLAASDVVVHSSSEPEPFGRVVVEAMLTGRPVIATAAGGPFDIIEHQVTGLLVPIKDAPAMTDALWRLIENRDLAKEMGKQARQSAQERFSIKQHITAIQSLYQEVLCTETRGA